MCNVIGFHRPAIDFDKLIFIIRSSTVKANLPNEDKIHAKIAGSYVSTVVAYLISKNLSTFGQC